MNKKKYLKEIKVFEKEFMGFLSKHVDLTNNNYISLSVFPIVKRKKSKHANNYF